MFIFDFPWEIQHFFTDFWLAVNITLLLILGVLVYLALKKPVWANFLVIILLPTYLFRSNIFWLPLTYLEICIWIVFVALIVRMIINKEKVKTHFQYPYKWPILIILLSATISVFISTNLTAAAGLWKAYFVESLMFFIVLINTVKSKKDRDIILWALGISTLSISLLAIYQKFTAFGIAESAWVAPDIRRVNAMFTSPNSVALYLVPIMMIYIGWMLDDIKNKLFDFGFISKLLIFILSCLAVVYTVSQGAWLALAAALFFFLFFTVSKKWTTAIVISLVILTLLIPQTKNLIISVGIESPSAQNRFVLWQGSLDYLTSSAKNFIFGAGLFGFSDILDTFRDPLKMEPLIYPHNIILNFWMEIGLLGLIGFVWLIFDFFEKGFKKLIVGDFGQSRLLLIGILAAMITILIHGLIDVPYFKNDLSVLFWIIAGLAIL
ncbi:O-antigen ligase family protein [Patescibacteria group bacterium]|nr:O-antigen ligase family protein [Patescibacteria group bacterium]